MSHIRYGVLCWGRTSKKKLIKSMYSGTFTKKIQQCKKLENKKKILNVEKLFKYELGKFMFKFVHNFLSVNFKCYFVFYVNDVINHK